MANYLYDPGLTSMTIGWLMGMRVGACGTQQSLEAPTFAPSYTWFKSSTKNHEDFTEINIVDSYIPTGNETESWAADVDESGEIMCYILDTTLIIAGNGSGRLMANEDSSKMFSEYSTLFSGGFNNVSVISGLRLLDTRNVTNMSHMFDAVNSLISMDVKNFDTRNVTDMSGMFTLASVLTSLDLSNFDTSNVTNMSDMFAGCRNLASLDLSNFDTHNVTDMSGMFAACNFSSLDLSNFNTSNVTCMAEMFDGCSSLSELYINNFDVSKVTTMRNMFRKCTSLVSVDLTNWDTSSLEVMGNMFENCTSLRSLDISNFTFAKLVSKFQSYQNDTIFAGCSNLEELDLGGFGITANVCYVSDMFSGCSKLKTLDLTKADVSAVNNFSRMFMDCSSLTAIYVGPGWSLASAKYTEDMFTNCGVSKVTVKTN